jgi:hypothetical protein
VWAFDLHGSTTYGGIEWGQFGRDAEHDNYSELVELEDGDQHQHEKLEEQPHQPRKQPLSQGDGALFCPAGVVACSLHDDTPAAEQAGPLA